MHFWESEGEICRHLRTENFYSSVFVFMQDRGTAVQVRHYNTTQQFTTILSS